MVPFSITHGGVAACWYPPRAFCIIRPMTMRSQLARVSISVAIGWLISTGIALPVEAKMSSPIGASMAVLATLQDADVLPPEGTREANRIIQMVIQFQSVFMNSSDPAVQNFLREALVMKWGERAEDVGTRFHAAGWTSEVLDALSERRVSATDEQRTQLSEGFRAYNMSVADFEWFADLFGRARAAFSRRGENIHQVFAQRRREMPGNGR
jgi:hypothetical protein